MQRVRSVFKYGYDAALIDKPVRYGPTFKSRPARYYELNGRRRDRSCLKRGTSGAC